MKKERQALVAEFTSEGESQAQAIKSKAEGIANTIQAFADRKAKEIVNEGLKQANRYYQVFKKDEPLATFLLKIETLPKLLQERSTTVIFDQNSPLLDLLFTTTQPSPRAGRWPASRPRISSSRRRCCPRLAKPNQ